MLESIIGVLVNLEFVLSMACKKEELPKVATCSVDSAKFIECSKKTTVRVLHFLVVLEFVSLKLMFSAAQHRKRMIRG